MKKIFQLNTCNTCQKILKEWKAPASFEVQNIKEQNISAKELDFAAKKSKTIIIPGSRELMTWLKRNAPLPGNKIILS